MYAVNYNDIVFSIQREDIQNEAIAMLGRRLTDNEMRYAEKGVEACFFDWPNIVVEAIQEAVALVGEEEEKEV